MYIPEPFRKVEHQAEKHAICEFLDGATTHLSSYRHFHVSIFNK